MQALSIFNIIVSVAIIIVAIYSILIFYKINTLEKNNREQQIEYLIRHSKRFLIFALISVILSVCITVGFALLVTKNDTQEISSLSYFVMISMLVSLFPLLTFLCGYIIQKTGKKRYLENKEAEQKKIESEEKSLLYFNDNKSVLIDKYSQTVRNFIEKLSEKGICPFISMFNDREIPHSCILVFPYSNSNSQLLRNEIIRDGLEFTESANPELNKKLQEFTDFFIKGLKKRIQENNEWQDEFTLFLLLYKIVRNNVIKYYHDKYLSEYGFENLEEFCANLANAINQTATISYVYYYIYENDINLPFVDTYHKICIDIKNAMSKQKEKKLENDLFGSPKKRVAVSEKGKIALSPIERVDNMSGAEFELFMTQYFENQGFKTTHTPISGDYGIDLIIENDFGKIGVQAKCYKNKVSLDAVQQVVAGLRHYGLSSGIVITNNYFQSSAIRLAQDNNITLWNRDKLIEKLGK